MNIDFTLAVGHIKDTLAGRISEFEMDFMQRVYSTDSDVYRNRLHAVGMLDQPRILDAGCGFGQWLLCMSNGSNTVHGMDASEHCVLASQVALECCDVPNAQAFQGDFEHIDAPNGYYDAVFAYSSMFLSPWRTSFAEVHRVLRPGGRFYFSANELGFYTMLWMEEHNRVPGQYEPREHVAKALDNTLHYNRIGRFKYDGFVHSIITRQEAVGRLEELGFRVNHIAAEGTINVAPEQADPKPFFRETYYGLPGCYEVLAEKA